VQTGRHVAASELAHGQGVGQKERRQKRKNGGAPLYQSIFIVSRNEKFFSCILAFQTWCKPFSWYAETAPPDLAERESAGAMAFSAQPGN